MDKNSIVQAITGLLLAGLGSAIGWLFNSIGDLKHNQDIMQVEVNQNQSELNDIWNKYNSEQNVKFEEVKAFYQLQIDIEKDKNELLKTIYYGESRKN